VFDLPRLSVDIDLNYIGAADRETMLAERPRVEKALFQVAERLGLTVRRAPSEHAGGKWRLSYISVLGRGATIEVDVNYILRVPIWEPSRGESRAFIGHRVEGVKLLDPHELAAGKLAALLARGASRDLFDARELLALDRFDLDKLRLAFVVYGGINRVDWRGVSPDHVTTTVSDVRRQLLPMLRQDIRPVENQVEAWTAALIEETRARLSKVLPLAENERRVLDRLNGDGEIEADLLTSDAALHHRIEANPGLRWKAWNVKNHAHRIG
jgi:hypothetical protein